MMRRGVQSRFEQMQRISPGQLRTALLETVSLCVPASWTLALNQNELNRQARAEYQIFRMTIISYYLSSVTFL